MQLKRMVGHLVSFQLKASFSKLFRVYREFRAAQCILRTSSVGSVSVKILSLQIFSGAFNEPMFSIALIDLINDLDRYFFRRESAVPQGNV